MGGPDGVGEDEGGNLMWLVDFKLDFFNDIEKTSEKGKSYVNNKDDNIHK